MKKGYAQKCSIRNRLGGLLLTATLLLTAGHSALETSDSQQEDVHNVRNGIVIEAQTDESLAYTRDQVAEGQIKRLYRAYFNREPEQNGFDYWLRQLRQGKSLSVVSDSFASSDEFLARYSVLSNRQFVERMYKNVLRRKPDVIGEHYWNNILASGTSRGDVMLHFSESEEFVAQTKTTPPIHDPISPTHNVVLSSPMTAEQKRGVQALQHVSYPWQERLPEWKIEFRPERAGYLGLTYTAQKKIVIYVRPTQTEVNLQHVVAHEIGHAVDVTHNSSKDRARWVEARRLGKAPWWPGNAATDFSTGAGDFAESFANVHADTGFFESRLAGRPSKAQQELLEELSYG